MSEVVVKRTRRKLGRSISFPINDLTNKANLSDGLIFKEKDHVAALKTRAAAVMYIGRHDLDLTTSVKGDEIWIMKDKDIFDDMMYVDLRG